MHEGQPFGGTHCCVTPNHQPTTSRRACDLATLLRFLYDSRAAFILVGSYAEFLNASPVHPDVVHAYDAANVDRLLAVLEDLDAVFLPTERRLKPMAGHLASSGHRNLIMRYGRLDLLGTIGRAPGYSYKDLLPHSVELETGDGLRIRVLDLETSIRIREEVAGEKDRAALPILRRTLNANLAFR
jgi:hypothetical protein